MTLDSPPSRPGSGPRHRLASGLGWLVVLSPFLFYAATLPQFGRLQRNDYWNDFRDVLAADGTLSRNPVRWLTAHSNEHQIGLHLPIWYLNARVSRGDNRGLSLVSLAYLVATFTILYRALPGAVRARPASRVAHGFLVAALVATPAAAHNWVMGFSGNQWYLVNLLAVAALATVFRGSAAPSRLAWRGGALFALASISHGTFLALGPPLLVGAWLRRWSRRSLLLLASAVAFVSAFYAASYGRPSEHPRLARDPVVIAAGVLEHVGAVGSEDVRIARPLGALGLLLFALGAAALFRARARRPSRQAPAETFWWLIALFALGTAIGTSVGRSGFGDGFAAGSSRYASLPALFWLGSTMTLILGGPAVSRSAGRIAGVRRTALLGLVALVLAANAFLGARRLHRHLSEIQGSAVVELAMRWQVWDHDLEHRIVHRLHPSSRRFFERLRHIPFDVPTERGTPRRLAVVEPGSSPVTGSWLTAIPIDRQWARVEGWASPTDGRPRRVLFLDRDRIVRGAAVFVPESAFGLQLAFGRRRPSGRWVGYLPIDSLDTVVPAVEIDGEPTHFALRSEPELRSTMRSDAP